MHEETPEPPIVFDTPQWRFRLVPEEVPQDIPGSHDLYINPNTRRERVVRIVMPPEFYSFSRQVLNQPDPARLRLCIEELKVKGRKRWYLIVRDVGENSDHYDLWFWTPSNKPKWV
jgi:hypothetical protein